MKYYETTCSEYIAESKRIDLHPELDQLSKSMPDSLNELGNLIFYGPSGVGKYTQFLRFVEKYDNKYSTETTDDVFTERIVSSTGLKTEKMTATTEKQKYEYHISDIHYEIDLGLLGCESKKMWNECFFQIVDIVSAKKSKCGIILCKNFQSIHSELLDVFYSYMQHCRALSIHIVFAILTEHVSFIPNRILQCCKLIPVKRPDAGLYFSFSKKPRNSIGQKNHKGFLHQINPTSNSSLFTALSTVKCKKNETIPDCILNMKETHSIVNAETIPKDVFNIVCDNIISKMVQHETLDIILLRDNLYDVLLYGLDVTECLWYVLHYFAENGILLSYEKPLGRFNCLREESHNSCAITLLQNSPIDEDENVLSEIMDKIDSFLKFYNNNYRPIYHLESIFIYLITKIYRYPSPTHESTSSI